MSDFTGSEPTINAKNTESSEHWSEFSAAETYAGIDLVLLGGGRLARMIVMKTSGNLLAVNPKGVAKPLTNLPAGYVHMGQTRAIQPGSGVEIIVYW